MAQGADFRSRITVDGADQAIADFRKFGAEGEKAFNNVGASADNASKSITAFGRAISSLQSQGQTLGANFKNLHEHATKFGGALHNVANNVIPRFKEVLGIATVGGVAGFFALFEATAKWGHELEQNAKQLGLTPNQFNTISQAAKRAGIDVDVLTTAMTRFSVAVQKAGEERLKAFGEIAKDVLGATTAINEAGVQILRGGRSGGAAPNTSRMLQLPDLKQFKDQAEEIFSALQSRGAFAFQPNLTFSRWLSGIETTLMNGGEAADKLRRELNQVGANLPSRTVGEQIEKAMPGFRDLFSQLKIPLFDKATGSARNFLDVFGDFLDKFKTLPTGEQQRIVLEKFGRGALELIPIMQEGSDSLGEFVKQAKELGIETTAFDKEISALSKADRALRRMDASIAGLRKSLIVPFADVFTPLFNEWSSILDANKTSVKEWATGVATDVRAVALDIAGIIRSLFRGEDAKPATEFGQMVVLALNAIQIAIGAVQAAFTGLMLIIEPFTKLLNLAFGTDYTTKTYALAAAFLYFSGILPAVATGVRLVWAALQLIYATPIGLAIAALAGAALLIYQNWSTIGPLFQSLWDLLKRFGNWLVDSWNKFWTDPIQGIKDQWGALFDWLSRKAAEVWAKINPFAGERGPAPSAEAFPLQRASGGPVPGRGSGDIVPAMLTPGEFVIRRSVVDQLGAGFFSALNGGMGSLIPRSRYATGGLVMEGAGAGGTPVHLHLDGQQFNMRADQNVAESLLRAARAKQLLSAGRKPGWAGGRRYGG